MRKAVGRGALISLMLGGGLLYAGISQAQDIGATDIQAERTAELVAASGGPASADHLRAYASDKARVELREDDVAPIAPAETPVTATSAEVAPTPVADAAAPSRIASVETPPAL